jgi:DNA (cytosine-5)-methyltransferase 1
LQPVLNFTYPTRDDKFTSTFRQRQRERTNHFKAVAKKEIALRFPNISHIDEPRKNEQSEFFVGYEGFFNKDIIFDFKESTIGKKYYSIIENRVGDRIDLIVSPAASKPRRKIEITITGLSKYLISVDSLHCKAGLSDHADIFHIWDLIQDSLTKGSQFYTLIDIYGHYANRGDTVKVNTKISGTKKSFLDKSFEFFGASENSGKFLSNSDFSKAILCDLPEVRSIVFRMREMRWDVRLPETHATIRDDRVLCTYPFPLLSWKAQLERRNSA